VEERPTRQAQRESACYLNRGPSFAHRLRPLAIPVSGCQTVCGWYALRRTPFLRLGPRFSCCECKGAGS
jgi:hypothetical protein